MIAEKLHVECLSARINFILALQDLHNGSDKSLSEPPLCGNAFMQSSVWKKIVGKQSLVDSNDDCYN